MKGVEVCVFSVDDAYAAEAAGAADSVVYDSGVTSSVPSAAACTARASP